MNHDTMTPKQRWLAAIHCQPVDRLPFWPKLTGAYPRAQVAPFSEMGIDAIHQWIGSDQHVGISGCLKSMRSRTSMEVSVDGHVRKTSYSTPFGTLTGTCQFDEASQSWHPMEFPIKTRNDIQAMIAWYQDERIGLDEESLAKSREQYREIGEGAITAITVGESPLMFFIEHLAGIENAHFLLSDYPAEVEELFAAIHHALLRRTELFAEYSPADIIYMNENTSTTLISPEQYRQYCLPHLMAYGCILQQAGRPLVLHMCGHLKALLPDINTLPVAAFEAFTSPTLGNTTLLDGRSACPQVCLVGGTNATLWMRPLEEILTAIEHDLDELPHHRGIVLTSAGVMPPCCKPETIKTVCERAKAYPIRM